MSLIPLEFMQYAAKCAACKVNWHAAVRFGALYLPHAGGALFSCRGKWLWRGIAGVWLTVSGGKSHRVVHCPVLKVLFCKQKFFQKWDLLRMNQYDYSLFRHEFLFIMFH
jgi:hypothetical protein